MNYFIVAGEASGDLHSANLAKALLEQDLNAQIKGWGGDKMRQANVIVTKDYKDLAIMGFIEVVTRLPKIVKNLAIATQEIIDFNTDAVILVDFSGFNLQLAKKLRKKGYKGKIFYYISPKIWVWNSKRVNKIKKYIDAVFCILPFEVDFYKKHQYNHSYYIGNPLMDEIEDFEPNANFKHQHGLTQPIIALLPGSRSNEINQILPTMLQTVSNYPNFEFVIAGVPSVKELIEQKMKEANINLKIIYNDTYNLLKNADVSLVTSGTATLEAALLGARLVLCYKGSAISYSIAKQVVNIDYIGLPNLIVNKEMVTELIQANMTVDTIQQEINLLLNDKNRQQKYKQDVKLLREKVGSAGASNKAAKLIIELIAQ